MKQASQRKFRVIVAKPGLDGHDRGAKVIAMALRDAGFEVIYTGLHQTCEMIVNAALQEDADAVCVSILSGAHMTLFPEIAERVAREAPQVVLFCGGIIPDDDRPPLTACGYKGIFGPGTSTEDIIRWLRTTLESETTKANS